MSTETLTDDERATLIRCARKALDADWAFHAGDVVIDADTCWRPLLRMLQEPFDINDAIGLLAPPFRATSASHANKMVDPYKAAARARTGGYTVGDRALVGTADDPEEPGRVVEVHADGAVEVEMSDGTIYATYASNLTRVGEG